MAHFDKLKLRIFLIVINGDQASLGDGRVDIDGTVDAFASDFIEASPTGVMAGK